MTLPADHGPIYAETDLGRTIVEPYNAMSAVLFVGIAIYWALRLRGRFRQHLFLAWALPVLGIGAVGGTLYHAFRVWRGFLIMDFLPILILSLAAGVYFLRRMLHSSLGAGAVVLVLFLLQGLLFGAVRSGALGISLATAINLSYATLALLVAGPIAAYLLFVDGTGAWRFAIALGSFALALGFRYADAIRPPLLPMGTHFLWHTFGGLAVHQCFALVYAIERRARASPGPSASSASGRGTQQT